MPAFARTIGIDYSGAQTPGSSLSGLRVYLAAGSAKPAEVPPPPSPRKYWTRREIAEWLVEKLSEGVPTLVGIAHGFSFPLAYFEHHGLPLDWPGFLDDFQRHWPTDDAYMYVDFIRDGGYGNGAARTGSAGWRRLTEMRAGRTKSVFQFEGPRSRAKATHAGLPWLRFLRQQLGRQLHFWPFDGWEIPEGRSAIAEVYPPLLRGSVAAKDAFVTAAWLAQADQAETLTALLQPLLPPPERRAASIEGWILGVPGLIVPADKMQ